MASFINTNIASLNAQRNLNHSQDALNVSLQRLSSGLRINSAKDDAAGMGISERMTTQIRGANQAARNANDGISLAQTAEGDLAQIGANLQRIRELAVQSSNASNSAADRTSLNAEAAQLILEIDRVANSSSFNGTKLLDGSFSSQTFQVGANNTSYDRITVSSIASAKSSALGVGSGSSYSSSVAVAATPGSAAALTAGGITINGYNVGATVSDGVSTAGATYSALSKVNAINAVTGQTGVSAAVTATAVTNTAGAVGGAWAFTLNGVAVSGTGITTAAINASDIAAKVNAVSSQTGVTATVSGATYTLTAADGRNIALAVTTAGDAGVTAATNIGALTLSSTSSTGITLGGTQATAAIFGAAAQVATITTTAGAGVSSLDLTTASGAQSALTVLDSAINNINSSRGALGAFQNRFASTVISLQTTAENLTASRSRIQDADFAAETASLTRAQILQQAGTAMLAQANAIPNGVMALLR
ncbi:MAG: flagellin [Nitrosomonadales bacterium]|nr:flagellin [Nitrosomonadales bacterium]